MHLKAGQSWLNGSPEDLCRELRCMFANSEGNIQSRESTSWHSLQFLNMAPAESLAASNMNRHSQNTSTLLRLSRETESSLSCPFQTAEIGNTAAYHFDPDERSLVDRCARNIPRSPIIVHQKREGRVQLHEMPTSVESSQFGVLSRSCPCENVRRAPYSNEHEMKKREDKAQLHTMSRSVQFSQFGVLGRSFSYENVRRALYSNKREMKLSATR